MRLAVTAGFVLLSSTSAFAEWPGAFFAQDYRDRAAGYVATGRASEDFAIAHERAAEGNFYGADVAAERGRIERGRADADVYAADRDRFLGRMNEY